MKTAREFIIASLLLLLSVLPAHAQKQDANFVLRTWYKTILELVRHTPTYSPPVASRAFAYFSITAYELTASGQGELRSLAGQLNALSPLPQRETAKTYDDALAMHAALSSAAKELFANTGPTGQRVLGVLETKLQAKLSEGMAPDIVSASETHGKAIAAHILNWSKDDGGAVVENMGFPLDYKLNKSPANWVPTGPIRQQQLPLLPNWRKNRTFAMPTGASCPLPAPPEYSEDPSSQFYKEAMEVVQVKKDLTPEQKAIARFWSDDPMLSPTPPGHWISIALQIIERDDVNLDKSVDVLARVGVTLADAFIGCWDSKFQYDLLRPVTYIRRVIDAKWEAMLITPPFPEYPSGHSTQSGAAAAVLTTAFGENFAFEDATHKRDGIAARKFASFHEAATEAGISRLYGGIHFRAAIERGLDQGQCIGAYANALNTKR